MTRPLQNILMYPYCISTFLADTLSPEVTLTKYIPGCNISTETFLLTGVATYTTLPAISVIVMLSITCPAETLIVLAEGLG